MLIFTRQIIHIAEGPWAAGCGNESWESVCKIGGIKGVILL
jgi:hypothetical protein